MNSLEAINYLKGARYNWNFKGQSFFDFNKELINDNNEVIEWPDDLIEKGLLRNNNELTILSDDFVKRVPYKFRKGLTDEEITKLSEKIGSNMPSELRSILKITACIEDAGHLDRVVFDSIGNHNYTHIFPYSINVGHDGFANFWILEITSEGNFGGVFFCCHDPYVIVKHSESFNEYLSFLIKWNEASSLKLQESFYEKLNSVLWEVLSSKKHQYDKNKFLENNSNYREFLSQFEGEEWLVFDLREAQINDGIALEDFYGRSIMKHDTDRIWVVKKRSAL